MFTTIRKIEITTVGHIFMDESKAYDCIIGQEGSSVRFTFVTEEQCDDFIADMVTKGHAKQYDTIEERS